MLKPLLLAIVCLVVTSVHDIPAQEKPLKVFVLVGQSNMQGHADVKTLPYMGMDHATRMILDEIQDETGQPRVIENVWISYLSSSGVKKGPLTTGFGADENKFGPELTFGIYMQKKLAEPILIIKAAWGGKSINTDFRPPSAGPYKFGDSVLRRFAEQGKDVAAILADKRQATGVYYRQTIDHIKNTLANIQDIHPGYDEKIGYELAGLVWFQGWNDMVDGDSYPHREEVGGYRAYSEVLCHLIRDFRQQLSAPNLPIVIGVMGVGGPTDQYSSPEQRYKKTHQNFRDAMAAPADMREFEGNVVAVFTENYWDLELSAILARDGEIRNKIDRFKKDRPTCRVGRGNFSEMRILRRRIGKFAKIWNRQASSNKFFGNACVPKNSRFGNIKSCNLAHPMPLTTISVVGKSWLRSEKRLPKQCPSRPEIEFGFPPREFRYGFQLDEKLVNQVVLFDKKRLANGC